MLIFLGAVCSISVFADVPNNSIVVGDEGFSIEFSEKEENKEALEEKFENNNGEYFLKDENGKWHEGKSGS